MKKINQNIKMNVGNYLLAPFSLGSNLFIERCNLRYNLMYFSTASSNNNIINARIIIMKTYFKTGL